MPDNDLEITEDDDIPVYTVIDDEDPQQKQKLLQILAKDISQFTEEDFQTIPRIKSSSIYKINDSETGEILNKFAYSAIERAMELRSPKAIQCALKTTEDIINNNLYHYNSPVYNTYAANTYKPEEKAPSLLQKYRADIDDLLFMSFQEPKSTGRIFVDYKLYPQAEIKQAAFHLITMDNASNSDKGQPQKSTSLDTPLGNQIISRNPLPNQGQYHYILDMMNIFADANAHTTHEDQRRIDNMNPVELSYQNAKGQLLIPQDQQKQEIQAGHTYKTDFSKYQGRDPASLAMHFNDHYQLTALRLGVSAEESLKQTPDNLITSLHKQFVNTNPQYQTIPDTFIEKLEKLPQQIINSLSWQTTHPNTPQIAGSSDSSNVFITENNRSQLGGDNLLAGPEASTKLPANNTSTLGQILLGTAIIGSAIAGGKFVYDYYRQNFGKDSTPEQILKAQKLLSELANSQIDTEKLYNAFNNYHNVLANKLNKMYDQRKQNSEEYKQLREELDNTSKDKENVIKLEEGIKHLKESYKNLDKPGLKEKYVQSLIDEYQNLEKICDNLLYKSLETKMKHQDLQQDNKPARATPSNNHASKIKKARAEQLSNPKERH